MGSATAIVNCAPTNSAGTRIMAISSVGRDFDQSQWERLTSAPGCIGRKSIAANLFAPYAGSRPIRILNGGDLCRKQARSELNGPIQVKLNSILSSTQVTTRPSDDRTAQS